MIARIRALLAPTPGPTRADFNAVAQLAALQARNAELEKQLADERYVTGHLTAENTRREKTEGVLRFQLDTARAEADRIRSDAEHTTATRCECGGDTELYWRRQAAAAEQRADLDRANAARMADDIAQLRLKADEADRLVHLAEQMGLTA